jgi:(E)-4-hydroxy-3-methylbut-2-enyl-diphosphate synthase
MDRTQTKRIKIKNRYIGGGNPILIQSMTNTFTQDIAATVQQILRLETEGCDIVRVTVPDREAAGAIRFIKEQIHIPLVADIHFDAKLAIAAIENGADKIRINPGNIGGKVPLIDVAKAAKERNIPIRVGVNGGSLEAELLRKYGGITPQGLVESAMDKIGMLEDVAFDNIVVSIKSSDVPLSVKAHTLLAQQTAYPLHIGITEAGTVSTGSIKSAVGLGILLHQGIGDTIRVSLTGDPTQEVITAKKILQTLDLGQYSIEVVSCPTCGRTRIDLIPLAQAVEQMAREWERNNTLSRNIKIAVMGCVVNGPGEAADADFGIAGGDGEGLLFCEGKIVRKVPEAALLETLKQQLDSIKP